MLVSASSQVNNQLLILAKQKICSYTNTNYGICRIIPNYLNYTHVFIPCLITFYTEEMSRPVLLLIWIFLQCKMQFYT